MAITTKTLIREFTYNGIVWPDPGPALSPEEVRDIYSAVVPEILSAVIEAPETKGGKLIYRFVKAVGTKG